MKHKGFIITVSNFGKNKTAKLKGEAFELLVGWTLREGSRIPLKKQQTIKKIIEDYGKRYCFVNRKFNLILDNGVNESYNTDPNKENIIFDKNSLMTYSGLKLCYKSKKQNKEIEFNEREKFIKYLIDHGFISNVTSPTIFKKFRLDYCREINKKICFLECKNKEKTYFEKRDLNQIISYGRVLQKSVPLGWITTVVNGYLKPGRIYCNYGLEIRLYNIKGWLIGFGEKIGLKIDCLVYSKYSLSSHNFHAIRASKKSQRYLNIHTTNYDAHTDYKPIKLFISDNSDDIKRFLTRLK